MKKTIGIIWLVSMGLAMLNTLSGADEGFATLVGLSLVVSGVWGAILLIKAK